MKTRVYILISVLFSILSTRVYADVVTIGEKEFTRMEQHGEGGYITDDSPGNGATRVLTARPAEGYKFAEWVGAIGTRYADNPLTINVGIHRSNMSLSAYFVRSNAYVDTWSADYIYLRSKSTDLFDESEHGYFRTYANGERVSEDNSLVEPVDFGYWRMEGRELLHDNAHAGERLHIVFYDDCSQISGVLDTIIPVIIANDCLASTISFPAGADVHVLPGATLTFDADATISGTLDIHAGGKAVVSTGKTLTVNGLTMQGDGLEKEWAQLVANGSIINNNGNIINYDYKLDWNLWYPLAVPYDVVCADIRSRVTGDICFFTIEEYNTGKRATGRKAFEEFHDTEAGAMLKAGKGYVIWGEPTQWNGQWQAGQATVIRFPMVADLTDGENLKTVDVVYTEDAISAAHKNWNLIGNPCLADYNPVYKGDGLHAHDVDLGNGEHAHDIADINYVVYSTDGFQSYEQDMTTNLPMQPFNCYFVQTEFDLPLAFLRSDRAQRAPRRAPGESDYVNEVMKVGVTMTQGKRTDHAGMLYGDQYTSEYELNADLSKMFGSKQPMTVYSLASDGEPLAYQAVPKDMMEQAIPMGFRNAATTTATIAFDDRRYDRDGLVAVYLNDIVTGSVVNLLEQDYEFTPQSAQEDGRLYISIMPKKETAVTTDNEMVYDDNQELMVYDVMGRRIHNASGQPIGVYLMVDAQGNVKKEIIR